MDELDSRRALWESARSLMLDRWGKENLTRLGREALGSPANAVRLKGQETSVGIELVDRLARWAKLQPWQLLVPAFDAKKPPSLQSDAPIDTVTGMTEDDMVNALRPEWRELIHAYAELLPAERERLARPLLERAAEMREYVSNALSKYGVTVKPSASRGDELGNAPPYEGPEKRVSPPVAHEPERRNSLMNPLPGGRKGRAA